MLRIRLTRMGRHKDPFYRIVAIDSKTRRDGRYIALLGTYAPKEGKVELREEDIIYHLQHGAQPSDTVLSILKKNGVWKNYIASKK